MFRAFLVAAAAASSFVGTLQAATLNISFGQPNYSNMVRDAKLRGDGGLQDWNLGTGADESNRFYPNFNADGVTLNSFGRRNTFVQWWDVSSIPPNSIINSATLTIKFGNSGNAAPNNRLHEDFKVSRILAGNNWVEFVLGGSGPHTDGSVTWNNRITHPTTPTPWGLPGALGAADIDSSTSKLFDIQGVQGQTTTVVLNITDFVQHWVNNAGSNAGLLFHAGSNTPGDDRAFKFGTKEDGAGGDPLGAAPSLVIDYTPGGTPLAPIIEEVAPDPDSVFEGQQYVRQLNLIQGTSPITWSVLAGSPPGTVVSGSGQVSGWTPGPADIGSTFTINIRAENAQGFDDESWQVTVQGVPPVIAEVTPDPDAAFIGTPYTKQLSLTQGTLPVTWSVLAGSPPGTIISSSGQVSGWTPAASDEGQTLTFNIQAQNPYGIDTESWQVTVIRTNNGFPIDAVFVVRQPGNGGHVRMYDKYSDPPGTRFTALIADGNILGENTDWHSITFSGKGIGNDARLFLAKTSADGMDIDIAEVDNMGNYLNPAISPPPVPGVGVKLSTIIGGPVGPAVALGNIRYNPLSKTLFVALNPNTATTSTAVCYEIPLSLAPNSRVHTYLGPTIPVTDPAYEGRASVAINRRDGTLYMTGQSLGETTATGLGDVVAFSTAGRAVGGTTSVFTVLIDGPSCNTGVPNGSPNPNYIQPSTPIYRRRANGDDLLMIPTNTGTDTPVQEFHLNTTLHPVDGNGNLALRTDNPSTLSIGRGWNGQQDLGTGDVWLGARHYGFHVVRNNDVTAGYELPNSRQWLDAAVPPFQTCNEPFADADGDDDVDGDDFALFQRCYTGIGGGVPSGCGCFDRLSDGDIDNFDFNAFSDCKTGANVPWEPGLTPDCSP